MWFGVAASFCLALQLCSAQGFNCSVTRTKTQTTYRVLDSSRPPEYQGSQCSVSWSDGNNIQLAYNADKMPSVKESSINILVNSDCIENVVCKQHCSSQINGKWYVFIARCTTSCDENGSSHNESLAQDKDEDKDGKPTFWTVGGDKIIAGLAGLGALGFFIFVLWKLRNKICSTFNSSHRGARYRSGRLQNADPNSPVVLVEN